MNHPWCDKLTSHWRRRLWGRFRIAGMRCITFANAQVRVGALLWLGHVCQCEIPWVVIAKTITKFADDSFRHVFASYCSHSDTASWRWMFLLIYTQTVEHGHHLPKWGHWKKGGRLLSLKGIQTEIGNELVLEHSDFSWELFEQYQADIDGKTLICGMCKQVWANEQWFCGTFSQIISFEDSFDSSFNWSKRRGRFCSINGHKGRYV